MIYVGSRGHHADIGGVTPGSMPPFSTRIEEEGVQIDNVKLVEAGRLREAEMMALLQGGAYPSRNPGQNLADLKAQIAANEKGVQELRRMVALADADSTLTPGALSKSIRQETTRVLAGGQGPELAVPLTEKLTPTITRIEREMIKVALRANHGRVEAAAKALGISRKGLYLKRLRLGLGA